MRIFNAEKAVEGRGRSGVSVDNEIFIPFTADHSEHESQTAKILFLPRLMYESFYSYWISRLQAASSVIELLASDVDLIAMEFCFLLSRGEVAPRRGALAHFNPYQPQ